MSIAVVGSRGQLGTALRRTLGDVIRLDRPAFDLCNVHAIRRVLKEVKPEIVINAAAYNFVDRAEDEPEVATQINSLGPKAMAVVCAELDVPLVHISSDYVFTKRDDNSHRPFVETDTPNPESAYALSKASGEGLVQVSCEKHFILRTCGLYGDSESAGKGNFVTTMLRLAGERDELRIVNDQHCTPTSAADLAGWIAKLIRTDAYGLYHATNSGATSWCEFAREIFLLAGVDVNVVEITTAEFGAKATRPSYSVLNCDRLAAAIGETPREWREALAEYVVSQTFQPDAK